MLKRPSFYTGSRSSFSPAVSTKKKRSSHNGSIFNKINWNIGPKAKHCRQLPKKRFDRRLPSVPVYTPPRCGMRTAAQQIGYCVCAQRKPGHRHFWHIIYNTLRSYRCILTIPIQARSENANAHAHDAHTGGGTFHCAID